MKKYLKIFGFGFLIWLIPFGLGMALFPIAPPETAIFDTIMSISLTFAATIFSYLYFKGESSQQNGAEGLAIIGAVWFVLAILLDAPMFLISDGTGMSAHEYFADIGLTYLIIPIVAIGVGRAIHVGRHPNKAGQL